MIATLGATILTTLLLALGMGHRSGRVKVLGRLAAWTERKSGLPGWAALPGAISSVALLVALLGMYWDISLHIDQGRDAGPAGQPGALPDPRRPLRVLAAGSWRSSSPPSVPGAAPCASPATGMRRWAACCCSPVGPSRSPAFPLDDFWHRLFGQDVTLWGPTHLMLIGGAAMTLVGRSVLLVEGARVARAERGGGSRVGGPCADAMRFQRAGLVGAFLIGLSTFQAEFDFGVPQFALLFGPILVMLAASVALVAARLWAGPAARCWPWDCSSPCAAACRRWSARCSVRPLRTSPCTWWKPRWSSWSRSAAWSAGRSPSAPPRAPRSAPSALSRSGRGRMSGCRSPGPRRCSRTPLTVGLATALAGGLLGALIGSALASDRVPRPRGAVPAAVAASLAIAVLIGVGLQTSPVPGESARVTLTDVPGDGGGHVAARVELSPRDAADDARWLTVTAWQGGGFVLDRLERTGPGTYRTTRPIPVDGEWKALLRLHHRQLAPGRAALPAA